MQFHLLVFSLIEFASMVYSTFTVHNHSFLIKTDKIVGISQVNQVWNIVELRINQEVTL